jgi:hypothetical protein
MISSIPYFKQAELMEASIFLQLFFEPAASRLKCERGEGVSQLIQDDFCPYCPA